jgi:hypothetical protein
MFLARRMMRLGWPLAMADTVAAGAGDAEQARDDAAATHLVDAAGFDGPRMCRTLGAVGQELHDVLGHERAD